MGHNSYNFPLTKHTLKDNNMFTKLLEHLVRKYFTSIGGFQDVKLF